MNLRASRTLSDSRGNPPWAPPRSARRRRGRGAGRARARSAGGSSPESPRPPDSARGGSRRAGPGLPAAGPPEARGGDPGRRERSAGTPRWRSALPGRGACPSAGGAPRSPQVSGCPGALGATSLTATRRRSLVRRLFLPVRFSPGLGCAGPEGSAPPGRERVAFPSERMAPP